jgi:diguanylate cyclase (GGDEF)-like protein
VPSELRARPFPGSRHFARFLACDINVVLHDGAKLKSIPFRALRPAFVPLAILASAVFAVAVPPALPPSLTGLTVLGPYVVLLLGATISAWFNRGRAFIAVASLLAAYSAYGLAADFAGPRSFAVHAVFTALAILVPLNVLLALAFPERGVRQHRNYRWLLFGLAEVLFVAWISNAGRSNLSGTAWRDVLDHWLLRSPPTPIAGRLLFAIAFVAAIYRAWPRSSGRELRKEPRPLDVGLVGALAGAFAACEWAGSPGAFGAFMSAAGIILLVAVLQESHRLAFRDELTGLPSRRALEERLSGLGPIYTLAMIDVDHFKQFNDTHGHETGDQVLKLVAARLAQVGGAGTAYRYGGEEFCVLFVERTLDQALPHLEALRNDIEHYQIAVRSVQRPKDRQTGARLRAAGSGKAATEKMLSVTVSIGVAQRDDALTKPAQVIRAADEVLYRAKNAGRNRICR